MSSPDFTGFGIVLDGLVTIGLIRIWRARSANTSSANTSSANTASAHTSPPPPIATPSAQAMQRQVFDQLQSLLVNYPSIIKATEAQPDLPAKNIVSIFTPLGNLVRQWGYEPIGQPWQSVEFDPQIHQPDVPDIPPGEAVYIRFIGYRDGATIVVPAKVSRHLPTR
jgi:hypothetical protein